MNFSRLGCQPHREANHGANHTGNAMARRPVFPTTAGYFYRGNHGGQPRMTDHALPVRLGCQVGIPGGTPNIARVTTKLPAKPFG